MSHSPHPFTPPIARTRSLVVILLLAVIVLGADAAKSVFGRQTATVTIREILAPRECRQHRSILSGPKHRSESSGVSGVYCGLINSDHGSFALPQSSRFSLFQTTREELYDSLQVGCRFEVVVAGTGAELERGAAIDTEANKILISATPVGDCDGQSMP